MPTDITATASHAARNFTLRAVAWSLGLFALLRLPWVQTHALLPAAAAQARVAAQWFGAASLPVDVTLACSGADAIALCVAAVLAYPASWRMRLAGCAAGLALILAINTARIGTLGRVAASPVWFEILHVYVWPAILTLAIAGYVFGWMRVSDDAASASARLASPAWRRFVPLAAVFLIVFMAASPLYLESAAVLAVAGFIARAAAAILGAAGISASAAGNVLWTPRGGFLVTQECISTPLIPLYLAAVATYSPTWRRALAGVLATLPIFVALGIARLLVVSLPGALASPLFFVHAFYQLLLGAVVVFFAAAWKHRGSAAFSYGLAGIIVGVVAAVLAGRLADPLFARIAAVRAAAPLDDPQGAIAFLPAFQIGLYLALCIAAFAGIGWKRCAAGLAVLGLTQVAGVFALRALAAYPGLTPHVRDVRGWAIAGPVLVFAAVVNGARTPR